MVPFNDWNGFQRINSETGSGGIAGVFRQGSNESQRQVFINYLNDEKLYNVVNASSDEIIATLSGSALSEEGIRITLDKKYDGILLGIELVVEK